MSIYMQSQGILRNINSIHRCYYGINRFINTDDRGVYGINRRVYENSQYGNDMYCSLLLHGDDMTDSSHNHHTLNYISASITSVHKLGSGALNVGTNASSNITISGVMSTQKAWCVDFWFNMPLNYTGCHVFTMRRNVNNGSHSFDFYTSRLTENKQNVYFALQHSLGSYASLSVAEIYLNTWHHVALCKQESGLFNAYIDGISVFSKSVDPGITLDYYTEPLVLGANYTSEGPVYIDEFRISDGTPRWTTNFTPNNEPYR